MRTYSVVVAAVAVAFVVAVAGASILPVELAAAAVEGKVVADARTRPMIILNNDDINLRMIITCAASCSSCC